MKKVHRIMREKKSRMFHLDRDRPIRTWNPVGGCMHHCYGDGCWAARQAPRIPRYKDGFDHPKLFEDELKKRFHGDVIVFVSSMGDLFGWWVPDEWILKVIEAMKKSDPEVTFFLETKNPARYAKFLDLLPRNTIISTTIETNRDYGVLRAPLPWDRYEAFRKLAWPNKHISIEPIMEFDLEVLVEWMRRIKPEMVSVGYDNYANKLHEPWLSETMTLITQLEQFTKVERKTLREKWDKMPRMERKNNHPVWQAVLQFVSRRGKVTRLEIKKYILEDLRWDEKSVKPEWENLDDLIDDMIATKQFSTRDKDV